MMECGLGWGCLERGSVEGVREMERHKRHASRQRRWYMFIISKTITMGR